LDLDILFLNTSIKVRYYILHLYKIAGPTKEEGTGGCRKLHSEDLHNLYFHQILLG